MRRRSSRRLFVIEFDSRVVKFDDAVDDLAVRHTSPVAPTPDDLRSSAPARMVMSICGDRREWGLTYDR